MKPLISVCMPSYNHERFIREAIESVLNQTYKNFELIIVDDCSTDNAVNIIKSYNDPRIRFYQNESNLKGLKTTNAAVSMAKGDFIAILHSDDKYDHHFLEEIVKAYNKYPYNKVFIAGQYKQDHLLGHLTSDFPFNTEGIIPRKEVLIRLAYGNPIGNGITLVIHKDALGENKLYDSNCPIAGDYELFIRLAKQHDFIYINKELAYYRMHDSNLTTKVFIQMVREEHITRDRHFKNTKLISDELYKKIIRAQYKNIMNKSFYMGFKYSSRSLTQELLNFFRDTYPELKYSYYWYLMYLSSFLINSLTSKLLKEPLFKLGKYYKASITRNVDKIILSE
ncbi:MAG: hypothetical protein A2Y25_03245 [Candidatus Melainabacteria bacterium GWF2_37_15]|nr:MAG: hypothetical protein A2Y25_03245 [Candidatus Melainabacteria bacterium GWF2_37_15]